MLATSNSIRHYNKILAKQEDGAMTKCKKNFENIENRVKSLTLDHNFEYYTLK